MGRRSFGSIRTRKGTANLYLRYSVGGRIVEESAHTASREKAEQLLARRQAELGLGVYIAPSTARTTLADLFRFLEDDYRVQGRRSLERVQASFKHLTAAFGAARVAAITPDRLTAYVRNRLDARAAAATVRNELIALRRAFRLAKTLGKVAHVPTFPTLRLDNVRQGFFEAAELEAVVAELPASLRPLIRFAAFTGWRIGECRSLEWRQVDFGGGVVRLEPGTTKNRDGRTFPFRALPALAELLERQREHTGVVERATGRIVAPVFHRHGGRPIKDFHEAWKRACERAGIPGMLVHDLRRTAVRNLERAGVPRSVATKLTGHKTEAVYRRYAIANEADLAEGVEKLAALTPRPRVVTPLNGAVRGQSVASA